MKKQSGLTLIEIMVAVAILTVLVTIALPQVGDMVTSNTTTAHYNKIVGSLNVARSEAVKRNETIRLCAGDTAACNVTNWEDGWVILAADDTILKVFDPLDDYTLRLSESASTDMLTYRPNGTLGDTTATFTLCDKTNQASNARAVNVNLLGQATRARDTDAPTNDIVNDAAGNDVTCP